MGLDFTEHSTNAYPDFATNGWQEMIDNNYIKTAPKNPYNNSTTIGTVVDGETPDGWHWYDSNGDGTADSIGATNYDEVNDVLTPGVL
jgi:hypothetical protein